MPGKGNGGGARVEKDLEEDDSDEWGDKNQDNGWRHPREENVNRPLGLWAIGLSPIKLVARLAVLCLAIVGGMLAESACGCSGDRNAMEASSVLGLMHLQARL